MIDSIANARILVFGSAPLAEGFAAIGLEVRRDADADDLLACIDRIERNGERAFLIIESGLAGVARERLARVRKESPNIVIAEIPGLSRPTDYKSAVDDLVTSVLGANALENAP